MSAAEEKVACSRHRSGCRKLSVDVRTGLTTAEAKKRLETYGHNELEEKKPPTFLSV